MENSKIGKILDLHNIPHYEKDGEIFADSMIAYTGKFEYVENLTGYSKKALYEWLGY